MILGSLIDRYQHFARNRASLSPEQTDNFTGKLFFWQGKGGGDLPELQIIFREFLLNMHCISDYSSDVLVPLIGWNPGQLPRLAHALIRLWSELVCTCTTINIIKYQTTLMCVCVNIVVKYVRFN
jgi:hypothetical protein